MSVKYTEGLGSLAKLPGIIKKYGARKTLLVTGRHSYQACGAAAIVDPLVDELNIVQFSDFSVNPKFEEAMRATHLAQTESVDLIVAIGGGSVMDMAKLVKAFLTAPEHAEELTRGARTMSGAGLPLITVPTTAGSGSEATHFAVVYIGHDKFSLASKYLLPENVILDGRLLSSASPYQRACNGLDALAQAIESAWAAGSTEESRHYSFSAIEKVINQLKPIVDGTASELDFQDMLVAANLAGRAINIAKTTSAHAWSYGITGHYGLPHGHAVWMTLPAIFGLHVKAARENENITDPRGSQHFKLIMYRIMELLGIKDESAAEESLRNYLHSIAVDTMLEDIGAETVEQRSFLSKQVNMQRMSNNPVGLYQAQIDHIFRLT
ncbi:MAG: phosphonoacetaldehyde reductase [Alteromonadaceae bacterium]|nr:phosphonoacetaldehyde reductase [Alteromonadaceae bacterium]